MASMILFALGGRDLYMSRFRIVVNEKRHAGNGFGDRFVVGVDLIIIVGIIVGRDNADGVHPKTRGMLGQVDGRITYWPCRYA